jgi:hypothetical protein
MQIDLRGELNGNTTFENNPGCPGCDSSGWLHSEPTIPEPGPGFDPESDGEQYDGDTRQHHPNTRLHPVLPERLASYMPGFVEHLGRLSGLRMRLRLPDTNSEERYDSEHHTSHQHFRNTASGTYQHDHLAAP